MKPIDMVLASENLGKIKEFTTLLKDLPIRLIAQSELGVKEIAETGLTFIENALIKARHASEQTGLPALADDSGLAVKALRGKPGIYSARFAGEKATDAENIQKLLHEMREVAPAERQATFHCVLAFMTHKADPCPLICSGIWHGMISNRPSGEFGFGYDPIFYVPALQKTAAALTSELKNTLSHRAQALHFLLQQLPGKL